MIMLLKCTWRNNDAFWSSTLFITLALLILWFHSPRCIYIRLCTVRDADDYIYYHGYKVGVVYGCVLPNPVSWTLNNHIWNWGCFFSLFQCGNNWIWGPL